MMAFSLVDWTTRTGFAGWGIKNRSFCGGPLTASRPPWLTSLLVKIWILRYKYSLNDQYIQRHSFHNMHDFMLCYFLRFDHVNFALWPLTHPTGILPNGYNPPEGFCWDQSCNDPPIRDDPDLEDYNVDDVLERFLAIANAQVRCTNICTNTQSPKIHSSALQYLRWQSPDQIDAFIIT